MSDGVAGLLLCACAFVWQKKKAVSSDKLVGSALLLVSVLIFVYYTVWVIVLVGLFEVFSTQYRPLRGRGLCHWVRFVVHSLIVRRNNALFDQKFRVFSQLGGREQQADFFLALPPTRQRGELFMDEVRKQHDVLRLCSATTVWL